ncbi:hypothetical protein BH20ACT23_BH20ACT23_26650 [soil metagenome]
MVKHIWIRLLLAVTIWIALIVIATLVGLI